MTPAQRERQRVLLAGLDGYVDDSFDGETILMDVVDVIVGCRASVSGFASGESGNRPRRLDRGDRRVAGPCLCWAGSIGS